MKNEYAIPIITIEEILKEDVLCASSEADFNTPDNKLEKFDSLGEFWDLNGVM